MLTESLLGLLLVVIFYLVTKKPSGLPPGIWGWPIVGRLPSTTVSLSYQVQQLRNIYGDIITWRSGCRVNIFLCNFNLIKTALSKLECSDRPDFFTFDLFGYGNINGIVFSNGLMWQTHRRFILRQLKDLGMGKSRMEAAIQQEASCLVQELRKHTKQPQPLPQVCYVAVLNVIWRLVADHRYSLNDEEAQHFISLDEAITKNMQGRVNLINFFPWLVNIMPNFILNWMGTGILQKSINDVHNYMTTFIEEHMASLDPTNPRDLLDAYLIEMQEQKDDPNSTLSVQALRFSISDLFGAGTLTTSTTIRWAILYLAKYPEVQARVQKEIDAAVSRDTLPSLQHKDKLAYFEAVIHEVHRIVSLVPLGVSHATSRDMTLEGYTIPKGTVVISQLECCHMDPKYWEKPHQFYPEHFLNEEGKFNSKKEGFAPFAVGRRACVGEALARMELFVFLSAMLQNFTFSAPEREDLSTEKDPKEYLFNFPKPFNVVITERK